MVATKERTALAATVDRKALARIADIAAGVGAKAKFADLAKMIRLETDGLGSLTVEGSDLTSLTARLTVPAAGTPGVVLVNGALFAGTVKNFAGETIQLVLQKNTLIVRGAGHTARLSTRDADDWPDVAVENATPVGAFDGAAFLAALKRVAWAIAVEDHRPVLAGMYVAIADGPPDTVSGLRRATFAAADGYCLAVFGVDVDSAAEWSGIVDGALIRTLLADDFGEGVYRLSVAGNRVIVETDGARLLGMLVPGNFPTYQNLIPTQTADGVTVRRHDLLAALGRARPYARDSAGIVRMRTATGAMETEARHDLDVIEDRVPAETAEMTNPWYVAVDVGKFTLALGAAEAETVTFQPGGDPPEKSSPIKLWTEDGWTALCMPMYVEWGDWGAGAAR